MAQTDSVPSSSRQLITGESAIQSTNLRAVKLPAVRVQPVDRHYVIGGADTTAIVRTDEAPLLWFWRERRGDVELGDLSYFRWYAASTGQGPLGSNIAALCFETAGHLLGRLLRNILILFRFRSRLSAFDAVSSNQLVRSNNQLVRSKPQGRQR
jgi:hypothetical protein